MKLTNYVKWLTRGGNEQPADSQTTSIHPVAWEYRTLLQPDTTQTADQEAKDQAVIDSLDKLLFEDHASIQKTPDITSQVQLAEKEATSSGRRQGHLSQELAARIFSGLGSLHAESFPDAVQSKVDQLASHEEVVSRRLTIKTTANYDKFCYGIQMVGEIRESVLKQIDEITVARAKRELLKEHYIRDINVIVKRSVRKERCQKVLECALVIESCIGGINKTYTVFLDQLKAYNIAQQELLEQLPANSGLNEKAKQMQYGIPNGVSLNHLEDHETNEDLVGLLPEEAPLETLLQAIQQLLSEVCKFQLRFHN